MGTAWAGDIVGTNDAHPRMECSNKGICDRGSGECKCFEGYDGMACERTLCPNECSNRGICMTQKALAEAAGTTYETPWDATKHVGCKCDLGYRGPDCSQKECPSGEDVLNGDGAAEGRDCSGRGLCDYQEGVCECKSIGCRGSVLQGLQALCHIVLLTFSFPISRFSNPNRLPRILREPLSVPNGAPVRRFLEGRRGRSRAPI